MTSWVSRASRVQGFSEGVGAFGDLRVLVRV